MHLKKEIFIKNIVVDLTSKNMNQCHLKNIYIVTHLSNESLKRFQIAVLFTNPLISLKILGLYSVVSQIVKPVAKYSRHLLSSCFPLPNAPSSRYRSHTLRILLFQS